MNPLIWGVVADQTPMPSAPSVSVGATVTTTTTPPGSIIQVIQAAADSGMSLASWITLIAAVIAASAAITVGFLQRKSAEDALRETRKAVAAADESAKASAKAADAAERGAGAADRAATQIDEWRKREETMRMLRSGAEMAAKAKTDPVASLIGQAMLTSLRNSTNLVQPVDKAFIEQVIGAINQVAVDNLGDDDVPVIV